MPWKPRAGFDFCSQCRGTQEQQLLGNQGQETALKGAEDMCPTMVSVALRRQASDQVPNYVREGGLISPCTTGKHCRPQSLADCGRVECRNVPPSPWSGTMVCPSSAMFLHGLSAQLQGQILHCTCSGATNFRTKLNTMHMFTTLVLRVSMNRLRINSHDCADRLVTQFVSWPVGQF